MLRWALTREVEGERKKGKMDIEKVLRGKKHEGQHEQRRCTLLNKVDVWH